MKKTGFYLLAFMLAVATICLSFVTSIEVAGFTPAVFSYHFEKSNIMSSTKMSHDDLMKSAKKLICHIKYRDEDLETYALIDGEKREVFNDREKLHMLDVKNLYQEAKTLKKISFLIVLLVLTFVRKIPRLNTILKYTNKVMAGLIVFIIAIIMAFALDFQRNFIRFHELFFDNDLWLLDPRTSILINMVPEQYFYSLIMMISVLFIIFISIFFILYHKMEEKAEVIKV